MTVKNNVYKNTFYSSVNIYLEFFTGLLVSILVARSLGPHDYGLYAYFLKLSSIGILLVNAGVSTGLIKFISESRATETYNNIIPIYKYLKKVQFVKILFLSIVLSAVLFIKPEYLIEKQYVLLAFLLILSVAFKSFHMFNVGAFKGFERFDCLAKVVLLFSPVSLLMVLGVYYYIPSIENFFYVYLLSSILYWLGSVFYFNKIQSKLESNGELPEKLFTRIKSHYKITSVNSVIAGLVVGQIEILYLKNLVSNDAVSFYYIGSVISTAALSLVPGVYSSVLFPIIARSVASVSDDPGKKVLESSRHLFVLSVMVAIPTAYYADEIIELLYGSEFSDAVYVLRVFVLTGVLMSFKEPQNAFLISKDRQMIVLKILFVALIVSVSLNYYAITQWGLIGATMAFVVISLGTTIVYTYMIYRELRILPDLGKIFLVSLSAMFSLYISSIVTMSLSPHFKVILGFAVFGGVYVISLILINALKESDYVVLKKISNKYLPLASRFLNFCIDNRLQIGRKN